MFFIFTGAHKLQLNFYGFFKTNSGVLLHQKEGPKRAEYRMDPIYALYQSAIHLYVPGGHYHHHHPDGFFQETLRSGGWRLVCTSAGCRTHELQYTVRCIGRRMSALAEELLERRVICVELFHPFRVMQQTIQLVL